MAEFQTNARAKQRGSPQRREVKIDLTPMVDLAFLLITFFMLTTSLAKPQVMPVVMPEKAPEVEAFVKASQVLTLLLGKSDRVYFYEGESPFAVDSTDYGSQGLRRIILDKKSRVDQQWLPLERPDPKHPGLIQSISKLTVLIKPTQESVYKNVVDAFDEMSICGVSHYMLVDITDSEKRAILRPTIHPGL